MMNERQYQNVPTEQLPGWNPEYKRACIAEDGLCIAYGDYLAARLGFYSLRHMLIANAEKTVA